MDQPAMRAALRLGGNVSKIAMYEPPYNDLRVHLRDRTAKAGLT